MLDGKTIKETGTSFDESHPYANRDPRLKATVMYTGNSYTLADGTEVVINCEKGEGKDGYGVGSDCSATGYYIKKYWDNTYRATLYSGLNPILIRYADILLMYAEAEVRKTGTVPSVAAINAVNQVRKRAGLSDLPSVTTNTKDAFLNAILIERGHEFFYEGNRKIDLIRFNKYAQEMYKAKGIMPTHQYMPIPNYAVEQAISYGKELKQTWERPGWAEDKSKAQQSIN